MNGMLLQFVVTTLGGLIHRGQQQEDVHKDGQRCDGQDLYFEEGATGDFSELVVRCDACDSRRPLSDAQNPLALPQCQGERPWLGRMASEPCEHHLELLSRTASNAYFAQKVSALAIPEKGRELQKAIGSPRLWNQLKKATEPSKVAMAREFFDDINLALAEITGKTASDFSDEEIAAVVKQIHGGQGARREGLRTAEFKEFLAAKPEIPGEVPPLEDDLFASKLVMTKAPHPSIVDITLVKKLRGVTAQVGFTRLRAPVADLQGGYSDKIKLSALTMSQERLPATETFGEGVLLRFDEKRVREWEERPLVLERATGLFEAYQRHYGDQADSSLFPGVRYFMLHSLSHLLMNAMSLECGYAAASLGERIYCAPATDATPMAAILIMTASSGAEGTLGGLVEQGNERRVAGSAGLRTNL